MSDKPLMPKATAVWLIDNTALSFEQIAEFVGMHPLEVKGIADEDVAKGIKGIDPIAAGQLTHEQIEEAEKNPDVRLKMAPPKYKMPHIKQKKTPRYTPVSKRQDKPDGIAWIIRNHPEISDGAIGKLIGTTRSTIAAIRDRTHWNIANIQPKDPVTLGLCSQRELDAIVAKAAKQAGLEAQQDTRLDGDREAHAGQHVDETLAALAREADGLGEPQPRIYAAGIVAVAVVIEDSLHPAAAHRAVRAIREDRSVFDRDADLIVEAVRYPTANLLGRRLARVQHHVERMVDVIAAAESLQARLEVGTAPGRIGCSVPYQLSIHSAISIPSHATSTPRRASSARGSDTSSRIGFVLLMWMSTLRVAGGRRSNHSSMPPGQLCGR